MTPAGLLLIVPVGRAAGTLPLQPLAASLTHGLGVRCAVSEDCLDDAFAFDPDRNQYHSTRLLERLTREFATGFRILGVTTNDLYVPVLSFVFGEAQVSGLSALVSAHRLREELYGLPADSHILLDRLTKEAVHELGHTFGLRHCDDWTCVMASTSSVERLDIRTASFCERCRPRVERALHGE
ncbi:MAG TPA: archaemetzincin family Zn-dependent metalloprotease [Bryobacteraceae bacterium]|nr:archaemetzincin family Zn-dependent metalloprotease [Bryobacteraceae bacterium]